MNKLPAMIAAVVLCAGAARAAETSGQIFDGNKAAPDFAAIAGPRTDLAARLHPGDRLEAVACTCYRTIGSGPATSPASCPAARATAKVRTTRDANGKDGVVLPLNAIGGFANFELPENQGFGSVVLDRPRLQGSVPFERWSRDPLEVTPSPFGAKHAYSDTLAVSYLRFWKFDDSSLSQTDVTEHRMEKAGITYEKLVAASALRALDDGSFYAELELSSQGVDQLAPKALAVLKDSGVYSLNGLYENDRQLSTSYHVACILEKK